MGRSPMLGVAMNRGRNLMARRLLPLGVLALVATGCAGGGGPSTSAAAPVTEPAAADPFYEVLRSDLGLVLQTNMVLRIGPISTAMKVREYTTLAQDDATHIEFEAVVAEVAQISPLAIESMGYSGIPIGAGNVVTFMLHEGVSERDRRSAEITASEVAGKANTYCMAGASHGYEVKGGERLPAALVLRACFVRADPKVTFLGGAPAEPPDLAYLAEVLKMSQFEVLRYAMSDEVAWMDVGRRLEDRKRPKLPTWEEIPASSRTFDDPQFGPPPELAERLVPGVVSVVVSPEAVSAGLNRFVVVASTTARIHTASIVGGSHVSAVRILRGEPISVYVLDNPEASLDKPLATLPDGLGEAQGLEVTVHGGELAGGWQVGLGGCVQVKENLSNTCRRAEGASPVGTQG